MSDFDLVIRGGTIGTASAVFDADVGIKRVGELVDEQVHAAVRGRPARRPPSQPRRECGPRQRGQ
jgi:hypothetical protein